MSSLGDHCCADECAFDKYAEYDEDFQLYGNQEIEDDDYDDYDDYDYNEDTCFERDCVYNSGKTE